MKDPRTILDRQAEAMDVDVTMTNVENPGAICSPVVGNGIRGFRAARSKADVTLVSGLEDGVVFGGAGLDAGNSPGKRRTRTEDNDVTMKDTTAA